MRSEINPTESPDRALNTPKGAKVIADQPKSLARSHFRGNQ